MKKKISIIGESTGIGAILSFVTWVATGTPECLLSVWIIFGIICIIDYIKGGLTDKSIISRKDRKSCSFLGAIKIDVSIL